MSGERDWFDIGFIVGARGWDHDAWLGRFYPDDLPSDWRLGYYANEFSGVLVPETQWRGVGEAEWQEWCDEVPDGFSFYLELSDTSEGQLRQFNVCAASLGRMLKGVLLLGGDAAMVVANPSLAIFKAVDFGDDCVHLIAPDEGGEHKGVLLDSGHMPDLRTLRKVLESVECESKADAITPVLFVVGEAPDVEKMREARTLLELMGIS